MAQHWEWTALLEIVNDLLLSLDFYSPVPWPFSSVWYNWSQHFTKSSWVWFWYTRYCTAMALLIPVQPYSNCLHQQLKSDPAPVPYGVPRGSVLGPVLFVLCTIPLSDITERHSIHHHSFVDDTQLRKSAHYISLYSPCRNASTMSKCGCPAINWNWMMTKQKQWLCPPREYRRPY